MGIHFDIGELVGEKRSISVRGFVKKLSPIIKTPKVSYFHGELTDGSRIIRFACFQESKREILRLFQESGITIVILNCHVKASEFTGELEIQFCYASSVIAATEQLPICNEKPLIIAISDVLTQAGISEDVHIRGRCIFKEPPKTVQLKGEPCQVFSSLIFDGSGEIDVQQWREDTIPMEKPFEATFLRLKDWKDKRYLTVTQFSQIKIL